MGDAVKTQVKELEELLINRRDFADLQKGLAIYAPLNSTEVTDALWNAWRRWSDTGPAEPWRNQVAIGLTAYAPKSHSSAADRGTVTAKKIEGMKMRVYGAGITPIPWDATPLAEFKNLTSLSFQACSQVMNLGALGSLKKLTHLTLTDLGSVGPSLPDLGALTSLEGLEIGFSYNNDTDKELDFSSLPVSLKELTITGGRFTGIESLGHLTNLEVLNLSKSGVKSVKVLSGLSRLRSLNLSGCPLESLEGIQDLKQLQELQVNDTRISSLEHLPELAAEELNLRSIRQLRSLTGIERIKGLKRLMLHGAGGAGHMDLQALVGCDGLEEVDLSSSGVQHVDGLGSLPNLRVLRLDGCRSLTQVDDLATATALEEISLHGCLELQSIAGLAGCERLSRTSTMESIDYKAPFRDVAKSDDRGPLGHAICKEGYLSLHRCRSLINLNGIEGFKGLKGLDLSQENPQVYGYAPAAPLDLSALAACSDLEWLDLTGGKFVSPAGLEGLEKLSWISMSRCTEVKPSPSPKVMKDRKAVQVYQNRLAGKKAPRKKGAARLPKDAARTFKLLSQRDPASVQQGVALAASLPEVCEALLEGVTIAEQGEAKQTVLVPNKRFKGSGPAQPYLDLGLRGLVAQGTSKKAEELRSGLRVVHISGEEAALMDTCWSLKGLTGLTDLSISGASTLTSLEGLETCASLTRLRLSHCSKLTSLEPLSGLQKITRATLTHNGTMGSLKGLASPALTDLEVDTCEGLRDLTGLSGGALVTLAVKSCPGLASTEGLASHGDLVSATFSSCGLREVDALLGMTKLSTLSLHYCRFMENLDGLADLNALTNLDLGYTLSEDVKGLTKLMETQLKGGFVVTTGNATKYPALTKALKGRKILTII